MFLAVLAGCVEGAEAASNADPNEAFKDGYDGSSFLLLFVSVSGFSSGLPDLTFFSSCFIFLSSFNFSSFCFLTSCFNVSYARRGEIGHFSKMSFVFEIA